VKAKGRGKVVARKKFPLTPALSPPAGGRGNRPQSHRETGPSFSPASGILRLNQRPNGTAIKKKKEKKPRALRVKITRLSRWLQRRTALPKTFSIPRRLFRQSPGLRRFFRRWQAEAAARSRIFSTAPPCGALRCSEIRRGYFRRSYAAAR